MDPLSEVIRLARPRSYTVGATDVGGELAIAFPAHAGAFFYSVAGGQCWLQVEGCGAPTLLGAGDCVVLSSGRPFVLASDLDLPRTDAATLFDGRPNGSIDTWNGGNGCMMFAAHFEFDAGFSRFIFEHLDPLIRIHDPLARAALRQAIEQMIEELQAARPGHEVVVEHLAHIALVKVLRFHLAEAAQQRTGWLYALADTQISRAMAAMQSDPAHPWTVASLSQVAAMSRTAFAIRFKATTGTPPLDFLTQLRMLMASKKLGQPGARIGAIAQAVGYESESAFSAAFKRVMGASPRRYAAARPAA
jgi:AraC-like DNA-binding protein